MKYRILFAAFLASCVSVFAQKGSIDTALLTEKVWQIQSDKMSGLGYHTSLPANASLQFFKDGTWKSSHPLEGFSEGNWELDKQKLTIYSPKKETYFVARITSLSTNELKYKVKGNTATYTYLWTTESSK